MIIYFSPLTTFINLLPKHYDNLPNNAAHKTAVIRLGIVATGIGRWPETDCIRCSSKVRANSGYYEIVFWLSCRSMAPEIYSLRSRFVKYLASSVTRIQFYVRSLCNSIPYVLGILPAEIKFVTWRIVFLKDYFHLGRQIRLKGETDCQWCADSPRSSWSVL